jgi:hypothetical protein
MWAGFRSVRKAGPRHVTKRSPAGLSAAILEAKMRSVFYAILLFVAVAEPIWANGVYPEGELTRQFVVQTGAKVDDTVVVHNNSDKAVEVKVYQTDFLNHADGSTQYDGPGIAPRTNSPWITFTPRQLTVPAHGEVSVYYTIKTPADDKLKGTYWSVLMVEPSAEGTFQPAKAETGKPSVGIRSIVRYAIKIVTHIGETGSRDIKITDRKIMDRDGKRFLQMDIENTGERYLNPSGRVELYDSSGHQAGRFSLDSTRIYPGCSVRQMVPLTGVGVGAYNAVVIIDNGDDYVWGAQYQFDIK